MERDKPILLVEHKTEDIELVLAALEEENLANRVAIACGRDEALDYLHARGKFAARSTGNPAFVLLEIKMPVPDGLEILTAIKSDLRLQKIPVIILSPSRKKNDIDACYERGANAFVVKSADFYEFTALIKQLGVFWARLNETVPDAT